jgi:hypothetical protein
MLNSRVDYYAHLIAYQDLKKGMNAACEKRKKIIHMYLSLRSKQPEDGLSLRSMQHAPPNIIFIYKVVVDCNFKKEFQVP